MFWRRKKGSIPAKPDPGAASSSVGAESGSQDTGTQFLTGDSDLDRRTMEVLLETIARVSSLRDVQELLVDIVDNSVELTAAERGFLILLEDGEPKIRVARTQKREDVVEDARFSTSIVQKVLDEKEPTLATVQSDSDALELGRSVYDLKLRAVMCVPLTPGNQGPNAAANAGDPTGVLYVDSRAATREFNHRDLGLFYALARNISIALENAKLHLDRIEKERIERNLELAQAIQDGLMPPVPKDVPGLEVHGWFRPAEQTSGDFYDFVRTKDGRLAVVIGDVTGHGIGPALITASAQSGLRSYLRVLDPATALTMTNQDLSERIDDGIFLTLLLLVISDDGSMDVINAGHHAAVLVRNGEVMCCESHGAALGMLPDIPYEVEETVSLKHGDVLLAFTDGLIEAHDPADRDKLFGEQRVHEFVVEHAAKGSSAEVIARTLAEEALSFSGGVHDDDITLVVMRMV